MTRKNTYTLIWILSVVFLISFLTTCKNETANDYNSKPETVQTLIDRWYYHLTLKAPRDTTITGLVELRSNDLKQIDSLISIADSGDIIKLQKVKANLLLRYRTMMYYYFKNDTCCDQFLEEAAKIAHQTNDSSILIDVLDNELSSLNDKGDVDSIKLKRKIIIDYYKGINDSINIYYQLRATFKMLERYERYNEALSLIEKALPYSKSYRDKEGLKSPLQTYGALKVKARILYKMGLIDKSVEIMNEIDHWYRNLPEPVSRIDYMQLVGDIHVAKGQYQQAITIFYDNLERARQIKWDLGEYQNIERIAKLNMEMKEYDEALKNLKFMVDFATKRLSHVHIITAYSMLAEYYFELGVNDSSLYYFEKAQQYNQELNKQIAGTNVLQGIALFNLKKYNDAKELFHRSLISAPVNDSVKAEIYLSKIEWIKGNKEEAYGLASTANKHAKRIDDIQIQILALKTIAEIAFGTGHAKEAYRYQTRQLFLDSVLNSNRDLNLLLNRQYQAEYNKKALNDSMRFIREANEEKLNAGLAYQNSLNEEKQTRNTFMYAGLGILLIAGGLLSRMLYIRRTNQELENKNKTIAREKERAEESEKAKEEFFNNISHEFRTPLTLILGPLDEALSKPINEDSRSDLQIMQRSALRLQGMINELLELSKLDFGSVRLQAKETNIVAITREYLQSFESLADQRKIKLSFRSDARDYKVWLDMEKYRKILANLLSNAFKFTDEGGIIKVSIGIPQPSKSQNKEKDGVEIRITDNGIGIPTDKLPYVFDRFFQTGDKSFTPQAGTGIGLALTKELVELHHGTIAAESRQGEGTTFIIFMPFGSEHLSETEMDVEEKATTMDEKTKVAWALEEDISGFVDEEEIRKKGEKPIVLITEDNPDMLVYIKSHLEEKYKILKARDGEEGLATALEKIPDLIISDVMMPRMDGNEMTEKLKTDQRTSHIPVILLTARASVDSKIEGLETGADAYLTKPFNARELKTRVKNLIKQRIKLREYFSNELSTGRPIAASSSLPSMDQKFIRQAIEIVNEHLSDEKFDVTNFAVEMALSRAQLHRKIKALTNKTTGEFIRTIRLNKAAELLMAKTDTVTQIAYETGFNNLSWFAKAFKEQFGVSPSEYGKSNFS